MKAKRICILIGSIFTLFCFSQTDSLQIKSAKDSIKKHFISFDNIFIGVDFFNPINGLFTDKKGMEGMLTFRIKNKWHAAIELGYDTNIYNNLNWDIDVKGIYYKVGVNWFVNQDADQNNNGFILGARLAGSQYNQTINEYPIQFAENNLIGSEIITSTNIITQSLPQTQAHAYWFEFALGGKIQIAKSRFYGDFLFQPKILLAGKSQKNIDPIVVPGYGKDKSGFNIGIYWGISYNIKN